MITKQFERKNLRKRYHLFLDMAFKMEIVISLSFVFYEELY